MEILGYVNDHSLYNRYTAGDSKSENASIYNLESCLQATKNWMSSNRLKMNDSKTEFIVFGTKQQLTKCTMNCIQLEETSIARRDSVKYLGVHMDKEMNLANITEKCRLASFNLYKIRKIWKHFDLKSIKTIIQALVLSHLDYGNALLYSLPETTIKQIQSIQNSAAKLIFNTSIENIASP